jgi:hypothetical protein
VAHFAGSPFRQGDHVQVNIEGLLEGKEFQPGTSAVAIGGRVVQVDPMTLHATVVFDVPVGDQVSITVPVARLSKPN